jgi:hypothetical protein
MHDKVTAWTRLCDCVYLLILIVIMWNFKMSVWPWPLGRDVILEPDTSSSCGRHLCLVILKSFDAWQTFMPSYFKIIRCMTKIQSGQPPLHNSRHRDKHKWKESENFTWFTFKTGKYKNLENKWSYDKIKSTMDRWGGKTK